MLPTISASHDVSSEDGLPAAWTSPFPLTDSRCSLLALALDSVYPYTLCLQLGILAQLYYHSVYPSDVNSMRTLSAKRRHLSLLTVTKMFIMGNSTDSVYQYSLINSLGHIPMLPEYDSVSLDINDRRTLFHTDVTFSSDGTKDVCYRGSSSDSDTRLQHSTQCRYNI